MKIKDLIYREDAIEALCRGCGWKESQCDQDSGFWCESGALIRRDIPTADRSQAEWIVNMSNHESVCSFCGAKETEFIYGTDMWYGYYHGVCPNCYTGIGIVKPSRPVSLSGGEQ